jgi:hypothetical protein
VTRADPQTSAPPSPSSTRPAATPSGLAALPGPRRLAIALFLALMGGFYGLALVKLATAAGSGSMPSPTDALYRYHGNPHRSRLHVVLDPALPAADSKRMYDMDGATEDVAAARRERILAWVERGAPRDGWAAVAGALAGEDECAKCHSTKPGDEGRTRSKADLPFDTYEQVLPVTRPGDGMSLHELATSSHNHLFGFALGGLVLAMVFTASRWRGLLVPLLITGVFAGAAVDVGSWWLTRLYGAPFHWGVMLGGAMFGACATAMAVLSFDELVLRSSVARVVAPVLVRLRLARLEP